MASLRDFIATRREDVKRQIADLKAELRELNLAEAAIKTGVPVVAPAMSTGGTGKPTIKEMVVAVLGARPDGAEATEIISLVSSRFGDEIPRSSLSPQLSRLKEEGTLVLDGRTWKLSNEREDQANLARPSPEFGGGEVRGEALPTDSPEGANPSTSISNHPDGSGKTADDTWS